MTVQKQAQPMVSVVIPNYNYAHYLTQRIDSVLHQTYTDYELILLDDASADNSAEILNAYKSLPCISHVVINEKNTGSPFIQWMKGITLSRGKYVWIAEADDLAEPDFLENCVNLAEKYTDTAICHTGSLLIDDSGKVRHRHPNHWGRRRKRKEFASFDGRKFAEYNLYWKNYIINASGVIFRREYALRLSDSSFLSMKYCGDWQFWFEMSLQGTVVEIYKPLNSFRQHAQKVTFASHKAGNGVKEDIMVVDFMEHRLPGLGEYKKRLRRGLLYKKIKRLKIDEVQKQSLFDFLFERLHSTSLDYRLARRNKYLRWFLPSLPTPQRERL